MNSTSPRKVESGPHQIMWGLNTTAHRITNPGLPLLEASYCSEGATGTAASASQQQHVAGGTQTETKREKGMIKARTASGPLVRNPSQVFEEVMMSGDIFPGRKSWPNMDGKTWQLELGFVAAAVQSMVAGCGGVVLTVVVVVCAQPDQTSSPARPKKKVAQPPLPGCCGSLDAPWARPPRAVHESPWSFITDSPVAPRLAVPVCGFQSGRPNPGCSSVIELADSGRNFEILIPKRTSKQAFSGAYCGNAARNCRCRRRRRFKMRCWKSVKHMSCIAVFHVSRCQKCKGNRVLVDNGRVSFCGWNVP